MKTEVRSTLQDDEASFLGGYASLPECVSEPRLPNHGVTEQLFSIWKLFRTVLTNGPS